MQFNNYKLLHFFSYGHGAGRGRYVRDIGTRKHKRHTDRWQKNITKQNKARGLPYVSPKTGVVQRARKMPVSKTLWYIINL